MELIIGRDGATAKLKVVEGTKVHLLGDAASVPMEMLVDNTVISK